MQMRRLEESKRKEREERWGTELARVRGSAREAVLMPSFCGELLALPSSRWLSRLTQILKACVQLIRLPKRLIPAAPREGKSLSGEKTLTNHLMVQC